MESSALVSFTFYPAFHGGTLASAGTSANYRTIHRNSCRLRPLSFPFPSPVQPFVGRRRRFLAVVPVAASGARGEAGRRGFRHSQAQQSLPRIPVKEIASFVAPAGAFPAITFAGSFMEVGGESTYTVIENKSTIPGMKWSFYPGTNLPMGNIFKIERDSKQKLIEFVKELRTFRSVDLSGNVLILLLMELNDGGPH